MKYYQVQYIDATDIDLFGRQWEKAGDLSIDCYPWPGPGDRNPPRTLVRLLHNGKALFVRFLVSEENILATYTKPNDPVCRDSCVEFFFTPNLTDAAYLSFEVNPLGTMLIGFGTGPQGINYLDTDRQMFQMEAKKTENCWSVKYCIPFPFLRQYFGEIDNCFKGNFMKCADASPAPHHGCWNEIKTQVPMFHVPECFGRLELCGGGLDGEKN